MANITTEMHTGTWLCMESNFSVWKISMSQRIYATGDYCVVSLSHTTVKNSLLFENNQQGTKQVALGLFFTGKLQWSKTMFVSGPIEPGFPLNNNLIFRQSYCKVVEGRPGRSSFSSDASFLVFSTFMPSTLSVWFLSGGGMIQIVGLQSRLNCLLWVVSARHVPSLFIWSYSLSLKFIPSRVWAELNWLAFLSHCVEGTCSLSLGSRHQPLSQSHGVLHQPRGIT